MAPHAELSEEGLMGRMPAPEKPLMSDDPPRFMIIGAGSRGNTYARFIGEASNGICHGVVEPIASKRLKLGRRYIWGDTTPDKGQEFADWKDFVAWELNRRHKEKAGEKVPPGVDGVFICVQDGLHKEVILGLAPLDLHIMCEKPLATNLEDVVAIYKTLLSNCSGKPTRIFSIGHVLRYSPHNMLLRKLLLEDKVIGDILSINHTEPVGWWHFAHSYVRGNWRRERTSAPSLLTKSCHDIDLLLWLLCSPPPSSPTTGIPQPPHLPGTITASGAQQYFRKERKPLAAGTATNCLSCPHESACKFSAKKIYLDHPEIGFRSGNMKWPVDIVVPDIEDVVAAKGRDGGLQAGEEALLARLGEDLRGDMSEEDVAARNWFGRCVYECDNDVCDDEVVTMTWDADPLPLPHPLPLRSSPPSSSSVGSSPSVVGRGDAHAPPTDPTADSLGGRGAKIATFHMVSHTSRICERYTHIYGTDGELYADSSTITVTHFSDASLSNTHIPSKSFEHQGHGGGDAGLTRQFVLAVDRVKNHGLGVSEAQETIVGCSLEEVVRSHGVVFAAESARIKREVVGFAGWWEREVVGRMGRGV